MAAGFLIISGLPVSQDETLLRIGCLGEPTTLNMWNATSVWSSHVVYWFYPSLYYRKPVTGELIPDICTINFEDVKKTSPDGLTYTFPLRTNVKWDDGSPLTAYDFQFAYDLSVELQLTSSMIYQYVEYIKARDNYTLEIRLGRCTPQLEDILSSLAVPKHQFEPMLEEARDTLSPPESFLAMEVENPISAGPFSFGEWEKGSFVKLITNKNYYGKGRKVEVYDQEVTEGPFYDGLLLMLTTLEEAVLDLKEGKIDYIWSSLNPEQVENLRDDPYITIEKSDELGYYYLAPNLNRNLFNSRVLRQALVYLIDKPYIVENVLQGYGGVAHSVVMPAAGEWYNPHVNKFGDSLSREERIGKATEMLRDVGYTIPDTGYPEGVLKRPNGEDMQPFEILTTLSDYDPVRAECGFLIQDWWREIGVPVTVRQASFDEIFNKTFETMDFDWFILGWKLGTGYPDHMRYFFHSDQSFPGGENPMDYWDTEVDRLLEDLVSLCDHDELVDAAWRAQEIIVEDVAYCPLYYRTLHEAHRNDTFTGWFTQLGGVAGAETPHYCLVYLQPVTYQEKEGQPCLGSLLIVIFGGVAICWKMH